MIDLIFVIPQDHMLPRLKLIHKNYFLKIDQTRHVVYCPHSRLAARHKRPGWTAQAPLGWAHLHSSHPTGCTTGCGRTTGCTIGCKV